MSASRPSWWSRQLKETMKEASRLFERFKEAFQPNVDDLDAAIEAHEGCCRAYNLNRVTFEEFIEFGKSLRARQAFKNIH